MFYLVLGMDFCKQNKDVEIAKTKKKKVIKIKKREKKIRSVKYIFYDNNL